MNSTQRFLRSASWFTWRDALLLAAIVAAAVLVRIAWVAYVNIDPVGRGGDPVHYHQMGRLLAEGAGYVNFVSQEPTAHWPPGYPAALALLYKPFGWHVALAKGLNIAFAAATIALAYVIGARVFDRRVAFLGALVLTVFPGQIYFSTLVLAESMFAAAFMLVLLLALMWTVERAETRWWHALLIGALVGLTGLIRAEGVALIFMLVAVWTLTVRPWRRVAALSALAALGAALALTPWTVRNAVQLEEFIPLRANASNVVRVSLDPDVVGSRIKPDPEDPSLLENVRQQITHPREMPVLIAGRVGRFYANDSDGIRWIQRPDPNGSFPFTDSEARRWRLLADGFFFSAGVAAFSAAVVCLLRRQREALLPIMAVLGWTALFALIPPTTRFHFALGPVVAIMTGAFVVFVWDAARGSIGVRRPSREALAPDAPA